MSSAPLPPNVEGLATLLVLQDQIKNISNIREFGYFVTNETHRLLHYNTAYLWKKSDAFNIQILDQSETAEVDTQSPVIQWLREAIQELLKMGNPRMFQAFNFEKDSASESENKLPDRIMERWPETLPPYLLWTPFFDGLDEISGGLILFREVPFTEQEMKMFRWLAKNYQYTWLVLTKSKLSPILKIFKKKPYLRLLMVLILIILVFPTRMTVTASATVESKNPTPINAPIQGIIKEFFVTPGDSVTKGQLLVTLDKTELEKALAVAQKKVELSEAKLRTAVQQSYDNPDIRSDVPILQAELSVNQAEVDYDQSLLDKADIKSPADGIAVFNNKEEWIGQPVQAGENILNVEDPSTVRLKVTIPVPDNITLQVGSDGKFYEYGQFKEESIRVTGLGYDAKLMPNKILAYQVLADFNDPNFSPQLGSQGTAKLYGRRVPFIYYLLRKPIQAARQFFGF